MLQYCMVMLVAFLMILWMTDTNITLLSGKMFLWDCLWSVSTCEVIFLVTVIIMGRPWPEFIYRIVGLHCIHSVCKLNFCTHPLHDSLCLYSVVCAISVKIVSLNQSIRKPLKMEIPACQLVHDGWVDVSEECNITYRIFHHLCTPLDGRPQAKYTTQTNQIK